jgi:hypothetical protein
MVMSIAGFGNKPFFVGFYRQKKDPLHSGDENFKGNN